ncbi:uncharacterized protein LOC9326649 isoform X4 [Arabidopsis lyrata subsp. lyrata]|nr:uncharacterized protein LOC9326649 isoform X4 [Arabidopsis lyrata subsp. lyrata]|eukprot:XP_020870034.1 uncharacterized protein LOC9326649 isoform X4 [Arabidopsis lyrata subsp. lyrata]
MKHQLKLWRDAEQKEQWNDDPPKVKVERRNDLEWGMSTIEMQFTLGLPPQAAYDVLTNPDNQPYSRIIKGRQLLENISRKVVSPDTGKGQLVDTEKAVAWNFLWLSGTIPIIANFIENRQFLTVRNFPHENQSFYTDLGNLNWVSLAYFRQVQYTVKNKMFINMFEGQYKVEPLYVDSELFCKHEKPRSTEEYEKCSRGQGRIGSKVTLDQMFKPSFLFNLPPISWYVRRITIKTMKTLIEDLQITSAVMRGI